MYIVYPGDLRSRMISAFGPKVCKGYLLDNTDFAEATQTSCECGIRFWGDPRRLVAFLRAIRGFRV